MRWSAWPRAPTPTARPASRSRLRRAVHERAADYRVSRPRVPLTTDCQNGDRCSRFHRRAPSSPEARPRNRSRRAAAAGERRRRGERGARPVSERRARALHASRVAVAPTGPARRATARTDVRDSRCSPAPASPARRKPKTRADQDDEWQRRSRAPGDSRIHAAPFGVATGSHRRRLWLPRHSWRSQIHALARQRRLGSGRYDRHTPILELARRGHERGAASGSTPQFPVQGRE